MDIPVDIISLHAGELLDAGPDAWVITDAQGTITFVNAQTEALFGYDREQLIGQPIALPLPELFCATHAQIREYFRACAHRPRARSITARLITFDLELIARRRFGAEFPVEISVSPLVTQHGLLVTYAIRDATNRKRSHEQLLATRIEAAHAHLAIPIQSSLQ
jgi:PAS domain S-box-containing protein